ncbi:OmpA family protein [Pedobacter sp. MC2016-05]|uniref:OmpA family protein n=1 Tax=Pedobacter sp. MC2016-05 TaxID=2994474 RepID=UPI0022483451|nr:OmpA family protein [Pedobacter sp. MC2016-05]MCX2474154.1 OmpA family protein [Pedobacter sp. MC2016-05]
MMKIFTSHFHKGTIRCALAFAIITLLTFFGSVSYAQTKNYANSVTEIKPFSFSPSRVDNINNAISTSDANFATLNSFGGVALGAGSYSGGINLKFPSSIAANKTTYIRIDFDQSALNGLLGGTLGGLVADIVGTLVIGNHQFEVGALRPNGSTILNRSSASGFDNNSNIKIVKDKNGYTFIAITPNEIYDQVYVVDKTTGLLDDIYFTAIDDQGTKGYISSDRESSCCLEVFEVKKEFFNISGILTDCKTKLPLAGATVSFSNIENNQKQTTGTNGKYIFRTDSKRPLKLLFAKDNYFSITKNYSFEELAKADTMIYKDYCLSPFKLGIPIALDNIYYEFNSAELTEPSKKVLDFLIPIMEDNPEMKIELGSHTDNIGADEYNLNLSNERAKSCVDYLVSKGISESRLTSKGYGESMPIAPNEIGKGKKKKDNPDGRAKNRRTEFKVTKK